MSSLPPTPAARHRFHLLDALRGIAAVVVVLWHMPDSLKEHLRSHNGPLAVDFFFCLSGFILAFSYERRLAGGLRWLSFTVMRLIRLYPVYLAGAFLGLCVTAGITYQVSGTTAHHAVLLVHSLGFFLMAAAFLPNLRGAYQLLFPLDSPAWSLFFELFANVLYAFAVIRGLAKTWLVAAVAGVSFALLLHWIQTGGDLSAIGWTNDLRSFHYGFARVLLSFATGILVHRLYQRYRNISIRKGVRYTLGLVAVILLMAAITTTSGWLQTERANLALVTCVFPLLVLLGALSAVPRTLVPVCVLLGDLSYPVYLIHMPFIVVLKQECVVSMVTDHPLLAWTLLPATLCVIVGVSFYVSHCIDRPVRSALRRKYSAATLPQKTEL